MAAVLGAVRRCRRCASACARSPASSAWPTGSRCLAHALAGREEAARRGLRLRAGARGDPARRADLGRVDRREARPHEDADRRRQGGWRARPSSWSSTIWTWWPPIRSASSRSSEGKVLADLPPGPFFSDPVDHRDRGRQAEEPLMLRVSDLVVDIDGSHILRGVSLDVGAGELVCLVGRNGAGKSTTFRTIMGSGRPVSGSIRLGRPRHQGIAPVRDGAARHRLRTGGKRGVRRPDGCREHPAADLDARDPALRGGARGAGLPRVPEARALSSAWRPAAVGRRAQDGIDRARARRSIRSCCCSTSPPRACRRPSCPAIVDGIASIRQLGHAVLIAESNLHHVPDFADRLYVIERGEIIFAGPPGDVERDRSVARVLHGGSPGYGSFVHQRARDSFTSASRWLA